MATASPTTQPCPMCKNIHRYSTAKTVQAQAATPQKIARLIQRMTPAQLKKRPGPGKWSISEIIHHLADCEIVFGFRSRLILAEEKPRLIPFDQNAWAANLGYSKGNPRAALETFSVVRRQNVATMRRLKPADWERIGDHAEYGPLSFRHLMVHLTAHDESHVGQIARLREMSRQKKPA